MANFCSKCGKPVEPNVAFCSSCGANIESPDTGNNNNVPNNAQNQPKKSGFSCLNVGCGLFLCLFFISCLATIGNNEESGKQSSTTSSNKANTTTSSKANYEQIALDDLLLDIDNMPEGKRIITSGYATKAMGEDDCIDLHVSNDSVGKSLYVDIKKCSREIRKQFLKEGIFDNRSALKVKGEIKRGAFVGNYLEAVEAVVDTGREVEDMMWKASGYKSQQDFNKRMDKGKKLLEELDKQFGEIK
jgi:hypothetical protein